MPPPSIGRRCTPITTAPTSRHVVVERASPCSATANRAEPGGVDDRAAVLRASLRRQAGAAKPTRPAAAAVVAREVTPQCVIARGGVAPIRTSRDDSAAEPARRERREHHDPEDVHPLARAHERTGEREREGRHQLERVQHSREASQPSRTIPLASWRGRPRSARPGARAHDRLARLRRERRRAPRRLRRLRAARPAGRHGAGARHEGAAPPRRGGRDRDRHARAGARRGAVRALPGVRRLPLPGSRLRRRRSRRSTSGSRDSLQRIAGLADAPLEPIVPAASQFHYRNKMEYSFTQREDGPTLGLHKAGRWDEVLEIEKCWLTSDVGNAIRNRCASGRARRS